MLWIKFGAVARWHTNSLQWYLAKVQQSSLFQWLALKQKVTSPSEKAQHCVQRNLRRYHPARGTMFQTEEAYRYCVPACLEYSTAAEQLGTLERGRVWWELRGPSQRRVTPHRFLNLKTAFFFQFHEKMHSGLHGFLLPNKPDAH
ncbi:hypothetical protein M404DRAFT_1006628 [Pisolithus tinctorius Marx 270]|uniref:Uncharacterized protein n=1 Tax=Pisolithus tinctorius Marx 270 TaxID=870435 RepID=A0A0C3NLV9_PISTI|nr:hypothetical protein M404DRAFT_1006628 [Pisolithus tinctorius Marx 270]